VDLGYGMAGIVLRNRTCKNGSLASWAVRWGYFAGLDESFNLVQVLESYI
jgi:hypothetical protein